MPKSSVISAAQIKSMRDSLKRADKNLNQLLAVETDAGVQSALAHALVDVARQQNEVNRIAARYAASNLEKSEAEQHLVGAADRIRNHTKLVKQAITLLNGISAVAGILTNLLAIFG